MRSFDPRGLGCIGGILVVIVIAIVVAIPLTISYAKTSEVTLHVTGKESVSTSDGNGGSDHEYRVYTEEGTFVVKDSLVHLRFNAADVYGKIPVSANGAGTSRPVALTCKVYGYRVPLMSSFKNILECKRAVPEPAS